MTKKRAKYTDEFKAQAVKKIAENNGNVAGTANWYIKANAGKLKGTSNYDAELMAILEENKRLKRQLKVAEEEREILKKATAFFAKASKVKFAFINKNKAEFRITTLCKVLKVKQSSYYGWLKRDLSNQQIHRNHCELLVLSAHTEKKERYGSERIHAHLVAQGHSISRYMVRTIKQQQHIYCKRHILSEKTGVILRL